VRGEIDEIEGSINAYVHFGKRHGRNEYSRKALWRKLHSIDRSNSKKIRLGRPQAVSLTSLEDPGGT
jgi:hypothetical protein